MLGIMKARLVLKKKSDALTVQFRQILKNIVSTKESMGDIMKASSFALTEAKYVAGENIKHFVLENAQNASFKVRSRQENVAGVKLPLDEAIKTTNRRVNAPENVVKPRLDNTITYINGELDELKGEDFFRSKKLQGYKKREIEKQLASAKQFAEEQTAEKISLEKGISLDAAHNLPSAAAAKDDDIIFKHMKIGIRAFFHM